MCFFVEGPVPLPVYLVRLLSLLVFIFLLTTLVKAVILLTVHDYKDISLHRYEASGKGPWINFLITIFIVSLILRALTITSIVGNILILFLMHLILTNSCIECAARKIDCK